MPTSYLISRCAALTPQLLAPWDRAIPVFKAHDGAREDRRSLKIESDNRVFFARAQFWALVLTPILKIKKYCDDVDVAKQTPEAPHDRGKRAARWRPWLKGKCDACRTAAVDARVSHNPTPNKKKFSSVRYKSRRPRATTLLFTSGNQVVAGTKSQSQALLAHHSFTRIVSSVLGESTRTERFCIQNIVASCHVRLSIFASREPPFLC